ncbi:hypothetical protein N0B16_07130 [Chryseobacterium sp. GMJ5]|uniref:Glycosyltransferase RgtA/B/C/D-like domain-containing protein n=1 Tax=Chryseobacterium gilvum TaxID=2976534 RepID=A0ABT2VZ38_9FLAO|nr:hypothetical protein [Chryseobacterium gilvum]MCU7614207.1 hypothetical protein [Chryseobacterium gilvum]
MDHSQKNHSLKSFWISLSLFFAVCIFYYIKAVYSTEGHYVYPIDDAYIHLSMAKNFSLHKVWGVTPYTFSSSSSSPLFTFIVSLLMNIFGNQEVLPLYFNVILCSAVIFILNKYYSEIFRETKHIVICTLCTVFFAVMHLQMLSGMEHLLQIFLFVLNIFCFELKKEHRLARFGFYATILLMGLVRFESMFYFVILAFVLFLIKRWKSGVLVLLLGFIPIIIFCYFNYTYSGYLFPNSVIVKGTKLSLTSDMSSQIKYLLFDKLLLNISFYKVGFLPIVISGIFIYRDLRCKSFPELIQSHFFLIVFSLVMICHSMFADLKGAFRYEAYMLVGFSMAVFPKIKTIFSDPKKYIKKELVLSILLFINILLMLYKTGVAHQMLNNGSKNIYEQQVQSAKFLHTYYNASKVVANDIGAITYYTDIHLLDIAGLASTETIVFNENHNLFDFRFKTFLTDYCEANTYELAIVYETWMQGQVPESWKKAAVLKISHTITVANPEVSIYSVNGKNIEQLKQNIKQFNWNKNVEVTIIP